MSTPTVILGRVAREGEVLWSIRVEPAPRLDPVVVIVGASSPNGLTTIAWSRALLKDLHPDRPAACILAGERPCLLAPIGPAPRCLPTETLLAARGGDGAGDLSAACDLAWAELGRCAEAAGQAMPRAGARLVVIGGPWDAEGEAALTEFEVLGATVDRIDAEGEGEAATVPPPDGAKLNELLSSLGVAQARVRGRLEIALESSPRRWWLWDGVSLRTSPEEPVAQLDLPLCSITVAMAAPEDLAGTVRIDLADGTPLVTALEPEAAGEVPSDLVAALGQL